MKKFAFLFSTLALASAFAASSYHVTLFNDGSLAGKDLKQGDYKVELTDNSVVLKRNKDVAQAPAKIETNDTKFQHTIVRYSDKHEIQEICLGGTNKKIIIGGAGQHGGM